MNQAAEGPIMHMPHRDRLQEYMAATLHVPSETYIREKDTQLHVPELVSSVLQI